MKYKNNGLIYMNIPFLGIFFPIEEAIVITCIVIVIYLIVFRFEFKQLSMISKKIRKKKTMSIQSILS